MSDTIISIRLPKSLIQELKQITEKEHYLDFSEAIRSILRQKCLQISTPYNQQIKKVMNDLQKELMQQENQKMQSDLLQKLKTLINDMEELKETKQ